MNTTNTQDPIKLVEALEAFAKDLREGAQVWIPVTTLQAAAKQIRAAQPQGDMRDAFEAWAHREGFNVHRDDTEKYREYHTTSTRWAWDGFLAGAAWQAAIAQASEPSAKHTPMAPASDSDMEIYQGIADNYMRSVAAPARAVEPLTEQPLFVFAQEVIHGAYKAEELGDAAMRAIRNHRAIMAAPARAVEPLTDAEILDAEKWAAIGAVGSDDLTTRTVRLCLDAFCRKNGIGIPATPTQAAKENKS